MPPKQEGCHIPVDNSPVTKVEVIGFSHSGNGLKGTMFGRETELQATMYTGP